jgi:methylglutamate dehydrogenase subunit D
MLERRSALASAQPFNSSLLRIEEAPGFTLVQLAGGDSARIARVTGKLPEKVGLAAAENNRTLFRVGPSQYWAIGPENDDIARMLDGHCAVIPLSSSRTRILLDGAPARQVLAKGIAIDFHAAAFTPGTFALTGVHHMPIAIHCFGADAFHIYAMRSFAMSVWEWLTDAALEYAGR